MAEIATNLATRERHPVCECKYCGREIVWLTSKRGKRYPADVIHSPSESMYRQFNLRVAPWQGAHRCPPKVEWVTAEQLAEYGEVWERYRAAVNAHTNLRGVDDFDLGPVPHVDPLTPADEMSENIAKLRDALKRYEEVAS